MNRYSFFHSCKIDWLKIQYICFINVLVFNKICFENSSDQNRNSLMNHHCTRQTRNKEKERSKRNYLVLAVPNRYLFNSFPVKTATRIQQCLRGKLINIYSWHLVKDVYLLSCLLDRDMMHIRIIKCSYSYSLVFSGRKLIM